MQGATRRSLPRAILASTASLLMATAAGGAIVPFTASLDGPQMSTTSPGIGSATVTFDDVTNELSWDITWSGLVGTPLVMHFHGPAPPGGFAPPVVDVAVDGPPVADSTVITNAQADELLAGLWFLVLHTTTFGGGELRGQVLPVANPVPSSSPIAELMLGLLVVLVGVGWAIRMQKNAPASAEG